MEWEVNLFHSLLSIQQSSKLSISYQCMDSINFKKWSFPISPVQEVLTLVNKECLLCNSKRKAKLWNKPMNVSIQHTADCRWVFSISVIGLQNLHVWERALSDLPSYSSTWLQLTHFMIPLLHKADADMTIGRSRKCSWQIQFYPNGHFLQSRITQSHVKVCQIRVIYI